MYIRANSNRYKTFLNFRFISSFYLSIILVTSQLFLMQQANAAIGGWTMSNPIAQGASTVYTGTKNVIINGADYIKKGTAKITPTASQVAKVLRGGVAGYALSIAVQQLIGSVNWVLDPANNQIKWKEGGTIAGRYIFLCTESINGCPANSAMINKTPFDPTASFQWRDVCASQASSLGGSVHGNSNSGTCIVTVGGTNKFYGIGSRTIAGEEGQEKTLPLDVVAQQVISNAQGGDAAAQVATGAAAADVVAEAEADQTGVKARPIVNQLENSSTTKPADEAAADKANEATGEQTKNPDKPDTTDLKLTFPIFCNWAPTVCEAAQTVISFPKTLTNWWETANTKSDGWATSISEAWTSLKEWAFTQPETPPPEAPLEIPDPALDISVTHYIQGNASCPNDREIPFSMGGHTLNLIISYSPLCTVAQQFKPAVVLMAFLAGAFIITNTGRRAEVGD